MFARVHLCTVASILSALVGTAAVLPASAAGPLYDVLPDSTIVAFYLHEPAKALPRKLLDPVLGQILPARAPVDRVTRTLNRLPGPLLVAVLDSAGHGGPDQVIISADLSPTTLDVDRLFTEDILPTAGALM